MMTDDVFIERLREIEHMARPDGPGPVLFHYFPASGLKYLIGPDADIACAGCRSQEKDEDEILAGVNAFTEWLETDIKYSLCHVRAIERMIKDILVIGERINPIVPYIFCLTTEKDSEYFWRTFTKEGGYSAEIDATNLIASCNLICAESMCLEKSDCRMMYLFPTLYIGVDDIAIKMLFKLLYDKYRMAFDKYAKGFPFLGIGGVQTDILKAILFAAFIIKGLRFEIEREWRLVMLSAQRDFEEAERSLLDAIANNVENPKPRVRTGIIGKCPTGFCGIVKGVWVSPQGDQSNLC